jgi:hypothetical protein
MKRMHALVASTMITLSFVLPAIAAAQNAGAQGAQDAQAQPAGARSDAAAASVQARQTRAQSQAQVNPQLEQQRRQAEQEAGQTIDKEAMAAIQETHNAIKALSENKKDEALAALERATGKIDILVGRNPKNALIPVELEVEVIDAAPADVRAIRSLAEAAEEALDEKDYPTARVILQGMVSEIRVRTYNLPLATYPAVMRDAAKLIDQGKLDEAKVMLQGALNTLAVVDHVRPLPVVAAQLAIAEAEKKAKEDKNAAQALLTLARAELQRAKELGYAGKDPEYAALDKAIDEVERQVKGGEESGSAFARLRERVGSFFKRQAERAKSAVASR